MMQLYSNVDHIVSQFIHIKVNIMDINALKSIMERRGISQREMAKRIGMTQSGLWKAINLSTIKARDLEKMAIARMDYAAGYRIRAQVRRLRTLSKQIEHYSDHGDPDHG